MSRKTTGNFGEAMARKLLEEHGLTHVVSNYRCDMGEIDLIMRDQHRWVFVEVKSRHDEEFAHTLEQITAAQCQRIRRSAQYYLLEHQLNEHTTAMRFDVVAVVVSTQQAKWLQDAF